MSVNLLKSLQLQGLTQHMAHVCSLWGHTPVPLSLPADLPTLTQAIDTPLLCYVTEAIVCLCVVLMVFLCDVVMCRWPGVIAGRSEADAAPASLPQVTILISFQVTCLKLS